MHRPVAASLPSGALGIVRGSASTVLFLVAVLAVCGMTLAFSAITIGRDVRHYGHNYGRVISDERVLPGDTGRVRQKGDTSHCHLTLDAGSVPHTFIRARSFINEPQQVSCSPSISGHRH